MQPAFFDLMAQDESGAALAPRELAASGWTASHLRGMAVSGALARAVEAVRPADPGFAPSRWSVDLFRAARMEQSTVRARIVRTGGRLSLVEAEFLQGDAPVARASALFLRRGGRVAGRSWAPPDPHPWTDAARGIGLPDTREPRSYFSEGRGWSQSTAGHADDSRKEILLSPIAIVDGERPTPWQFTAEAADVASLVQHWGSAGQEYINADLNVHLVDLPSGELIRLAAADRLEHDGIATGTAHLWDADHRLGTVTTTAVANGDHALDPGAILDR